MAFDLSLPGAADLDSSQIIGQGAVSEDLGTNRSFLVFRARPLPTSRLMLFDHTCCVLVGAQRHKLGMSKPISCGPLQKFYLRDGLGAKPNAFLHFPRQLVRRPNEICGYPAD